MLIDALRHHELHRLPTGTLFPMPHLFSTHGHIHSRPLCPHLYLASVTGDASIMVPTASAVSRSALSDKLLRTVSPTAIHRTPFVPLIALARYSYLHSLQALHVPVLSQLPQLLVVMAFPCFCPRRAPYAPYPATRATYPRAKFKSSAPIQCFAQLLRSPGLCRCARIGTTHGCASPSPISAAALGPRWLSVTLSQSTAGHDPDAAWDDTLGCI